jgi:RHS repeat-associated protein
VLKRTMLDPLGRPTEEIEDTHQRISSRTILDKGQAISSTQFLYDSLGSLVKEQTVVFDLNSGKWLRDYAVHRTYTNRGLLESETEWPASKTTRYHYDSMQRLVKKIKPDGVEISYSYDPLGNLQTESSSDKTIDYQYTHDSHGNLIQIKDKMHEFTLNRTFDLCDRLIEEEIFPGVRVAFVYDELDRPTQMTLPDGSSINYTYDAFNLKKIERLNPAGKCLYPVRVSHDWQGNLLESESPAGKIHFSYDLLNRAISIQSPHWGASLDQFDPVGNLLQMTLHDPDGTHHAGFAYDRLNQVTCESAFGHEFTFDSLGNCLSKNHDEQAINDLNQLTNTTEGSTHYDLNGNLISEKDHTVKYIYDALNRLTSREDESGKTTFLYDALGRLIEVRDREGVRKLIYQGSQEIGSVKDNALYELRVVHPEQEHTFAIEFVGKEFFPIQDAHHNICALQNSNGSLAQWGRFSAFGEKTCQGGVQLENPWGYANRRELASLVLFTHRFYHPRQMRWITTDPIGFQDGLNLYRFVRNNPYCYRDPDGRYAIVVEIVIISFEALCAAISETTIGALLGTAVGVGLAVAYNDDIKDAIHLNQDGENEEKTEQDGKRKKPPYCGQELGDDPTKSPGPGFEWKGRGKPGIGQGSWVKGKRADGSLERLYPDLEHPPPKAPHWDYKGPDYPTGAELFLDGTWKLKDL